LGFGPIDGAVHRILLLRSDIATLWRLRGINIISQGDVVIIFILRIGILFHLEIFDQETKGELAAYTELRSNSDFTIVNIDDSFTNIETHAYSLLVLLQTSFELAKHFE